MKSRFLSHGHPKSAASLRGDLGYSVYLVVYFDKWKCVGPRSVVAGHLRVRDGMAVLIWREINLTLFTNCVSGQIKPAIISLLLHSLISIRERTSNAIWAVVGPAVHR